MAQEKTPARKPTKKDLEAYRKFLEAMLAHLTGDISSLEKEALGERPKNSDQQGEGSSDGYYQELSLLLLERDEDTVRDVLDALERINQGTYGACETCEEWILRERLKAVPHARNCIDCQRAQEAEGA